MCIRDRRMTREVIEWICDEARRLGVEPRELHKLLTMLEGFSVWPSEEDLARIKRALDRGFSMREVGQILSVMLKSGASIDEALQMLETVTRDATMKLGSEIAVKYWGNRLALLLRRVIRRGQEIEAEVDVV